VCDLAHLAFTSSSGWARWAFTTPALPALITLRRGRSVRRVAWPASWVGVYALERNWGFIAWQVTTTAAIGVFCIVQRWG